MLQQSARAAQRAALCVALPTRARPARPNRTAPGLLTARQISLESSASSSRTSVRPRSTLTYRSYAVSDFDSMIFYKCRMLGFLAHRGIRTTVLHDSDAATCNAYSVCPASLHKI